MVTSQKCYTSAPTIVLLVAAGEMGMILALSKFGTFSNLSLMLSSATDIYSNSATFSFHNSNYTSP